MARIAFCGFGGLGHIQPALFLGRTLQKRSHHISFVLPPHFQNVVKGVGEFWPYGESLPEPKAVPVSVARPCSLFNFVITKGLLVL